MKGSWAAADLPVLRTALLVILLAGIAGTFAELLLLEHTEGVWQNVPLLLLLLGAGALAAHGIRPGRSSLRAIRFTMILLVLSGLAGLLLHYRGNVEFELEMHPRAAGFELFWAALRGATPALAPGSLAQLGLIGLAYTFRHPAGRRHEENPQPHEE